ncbi:dipeptide ABC transporter ATP-binding protein [Propionibacteriaceae bacterium G57]|uniref:dipeptide ABC transporter ATP-binding protein n=1 Tax=Aestuariimicrobium sp. G57 TaxID=3418485 RepID=UPI003DA6F153
MDERLRRATADDRDAIVEVFLACWRESYASFLPPSAREAMTDERAAQLWQRALDAGTTVVAEVAGRVEGLVKYELVEPGVGAVHSLYVHPRAQGQGLGRVLLEHAQQQLAEAGADRLWLWVLQGNASSITFYARNGWAPTGVERQGDFDHAEVQLGRAVEREGSSPVLRIDDLSVTFRGRRGEVAAVRNVSFEVHSGETVAVVGESGSGKSTTAAAINRLLPASATITSGSILFEGREMTTLPERQLVRLRGAGIGLVPQDPMSNLNPMMRVGAQIAEALEVHHLARGEAAWRRAVELLTMVGIPEAERRARQYPHEFSGGMRQRVLIAMGLACRPRLLIADEPTSALDVTVQRRVLDELAELAADLGAAVCLITHDLGLAAERADRVLVMHRGQVVESGPSAQVLRDPQHEYTKRLIAAAPSLNAQRPRELADRTTDAGAALVHVQGLTKEFALRAPKKGEPGMFRAVDDVSFTIGRGQTVSIVGESGSGKSTTANLVLGLEPITAGSIMFDGQDVARLRGREAMAFRRRVQPVFQNPFASLDPRYTVERSVAEPLVVHRIGDARSRRDRVVELLEQVALPADYVTRMPHELSGGQCQRVAIARALALEPELVVLDEAVSALDVLVQAQVLDLLDELQQRLGLSYLFISHDLAVVRMISDQVHVMQRGRIIESGTPEQIFDDPQQDYTKELLAAIPGVGLAS